MRVVQVQRTYTDSLPNPALVVYNAPVDPITH